MRRHTTISHERPYRVNPSSGFTLLELLVVMVVAATAIAVIGPNIGKGIAAAELKSATRDLASALRSVRSRAITKSEESRLVLNVQSKKYQISGQRKTFSLPNSVRLSLFTANSERQEDNQGAIRFFSDGSSTGGRITLEAGERRRLVDVNWLTGQITTRIEFADAN